MGSEPRDHEPGGSVVRSIGCVENGRHDRADDRWGVISLIALDQTQFDPRALRGLDEFSHVEVIFHLNQLVEDAVHRGTRHPRDNTAWPAVGIFARRAAARPNRLGVTRCRLLKVDPLRLTVDGLDALGGSPVLDVKPYLEEFGPRGTVRQPTWARELMRGYYG